MIFKNKHTGHTLRAYKRKATMRVFNIPTEMTECGITLEGNDDTFQGEIINPTHITNCLDNNIVWKYINRFMECTSHREIWYVKSLARKGLLENQEVVIDGKEAKLLHWNDSTNFHPMYSFKNKDGSWSKSKRILYGGTMIEGYKDFNNRLGER